MLRNGLPKSLFLNSMTYDLVNPGDFFADFGMAVVSLRVETEVDEVREL